MKLHPLIFCILSMLTAPQVGNGSEMIVSIAEISRKIRPADKLADSPDLTIRLKACRNEYECAQLVLRNSGDEIDNVRFEIIPPKNSNYEFQEKNVEIFLAHYIEVTTPSDSLGVTGKLPDPLVPLSRPIDLVAGTSRSVWLKVHVDRNVPAGNYAGRLNILYGENIRSVPIELEVWDITLNDKDKMPLVVGLQYESIHRLDNPSGNPATLSQTVLPAYYETLRNLEVRPSFIYNAEPAFQQVGEDFEFDFTGFQNSISAAYQDRLAGPIAIPFAKNWPADTSQHPLFSETYNEIVTAYLQAVVQHLKAQNLLDEAYVYFAEIDEPKSKDEFENIDAFLDLFYEAAPELKVLLTVYANCHDDENFDLKKFDRPNVLWSPNICYLHGYAIHIKEVPILPFLTLKRGPSDWTKGFEEQLLQGRSLWCYINPSNWILGEVKQNFPNLYIDRPGVDHRILPWAASLHGVSAIGHWAATYWTDADNPWVNCPRGEGNEQPNGDGSLIYPYTDSNLYTGQPDPMRPIVSIRLELYREGAEDLALLRLLPADEQSGYREHLVRSLTLFEKDDSVFVKMRKLMATAITSETE